MVAPMGGVADAIAQERGRILARLETDRYNRNILPELHKCLHSQVQNDWYDCEINLAILKLYQFHPDQDTVDIDVLIKVLIKAIMNLPEPDFQLALYLIPEPYQSMEEVQDLARLVEKLEMGQFKEFWRLYRDRAQLFSLFPQFEQTMRAFILDTLSLTYASIPRRILAESLDMNDLELDNTFPKEVCEGKFVRLEENVENQPKPTSYEKESDIQLNHISALMTNLMG